MSGLDLVKQKLADYTRAFYTLRVLRGAILWLGLSVGGFLLFSALEYFFRFSQLARQLIFWSYLTVFLLWLTLRVFIPFLQMQNWIKGLSQREAAQRIGKSRKGLDDKILNTLGLSSLMGEDNSLVLAAIEQKAAEIKHLDFKTFVDRGSLKKVWPYALVPLLLFLALGLSEKGREVLKSSQRVVLYNQDFRAPAPFSFKVDQYVYQVESGKDLSISVGIEGELVPERISAKLGGVSLIPRKQDVDLWVLDLEQLRQDQSLVFEAMGYESEPVRIKVLQSPSIAAFNLRAVPPSYTGYKQERKSLSPEMKFPEGTQLTFEAVGLKATKELNLIKSDRALRFNGPELSLVATEDFQYDISAQGEDLDKVLMKSARIRVIKDQKPQVEALLEKDTSLENLFWAQLDYDDDYGISKVERHLELAGRHVVERIAVGESIDRLYLDSLKSIKGEVRLFYRVWDNDAVNGSKFRDSRNLRLDLLSEAEKQAQIDSSFSQIRSSFKNQEDRRRKFDEDLKKLNRSFNEQESMGWQERQELKELLRNFEKNQKQQQKRKKELEKNLEKLESKDLDKEEVKERLKEMSEAEKELEKLKEEIEKLLEELDLNKMQEKLQQLQEENKQAQRREERLDDLLKDLMFQRDLLKESQRLKELADRLKEMSKSESTKPESLKEAKEDLAKSTEKLEEMAKDNQALEKELNSDEFQSQKEKAEQNLDQAQKQSKAGKSGESKESQQKAGEGAEEMSESLMSMMNSMQEQALQVNMESLRRILENLKAYSKEVEESGLAIQDLGKQDPLFRDLLKEQSRLMAGSKVIEDSLIVLSEKAPQVKETVFKELSDMQSALRKAQLELQEQGIAKASTHHQYSMMAANNLALLLDESLQNMMSMMAQKKPGNQNCEKPGNGKPKPGQMSEKLSKMGKKVDKLQKGTKDGKGLGSNGKEMAQILSEQEALREMLSKMEEGEKGYGQNKAKMIEELDKMEDALLREDIAEVKERFKRIESRMLESEKALEERKQKEEREADRANDKAMRQGDQLKYQEGKKRPGTDRFKRNGLKLNDFYYEIGRKGLSD